MDTAKKPDYPINIIGIRHGEKLYEVLLSREEMAFAKDLGDYYQIMPDLRDLNYDVYFEEGFKTATKIEEYNSDNTRRLQLGEMTTLLKKLDLSSYFVA